MTVDDVDVEMAAQTENSPTLDSGKPLSPSQCFAFPFPLSHSPPPTIANDTRRPSRGYTSDNTKTRDLYEYSSPTSLRATPLFNNLTDEQPFIELSNFTTVIKVHLFRISMWPAAMKVSGVR